MFRVVLMLCLLALPSVAVADAITVIGGDNIGSSNSTVNGNGAIAAQVGRYPLWFHQIAVPAIPFTSDGTAKLHDFRFVAALSQLRYPDGYTSRVDWSEHIWGFGIWSDAGYKAEQQPLGWHYFGATPDNWSGFNQVSAELTLPNTTPFGNYGTGSDTTQDLYEFRFAFGDDADRYFDPVSGWNNADELFVNPLPAGDYFFGMGSTVDVESFGWPGLGITVSPEHPDYWFDDNTMLPQAVFPNLTTDPTAGIAFSVRVTSVPEPSGLALLGVLIPIALGRRKRHE